MKQKKLTQATLCLALSTSMIASYAAPVLAQEPVSVTAAEQTEEETIRYSGNLALNKPATASSEEASTVSADKVTDGYRSTVNNVKHHWGSARGTGPDWIYVDLESEQSIKKIDIYWESQKADSYKVQIATENPGEESSWQNVKVSDTWPDSINESIVLDEEVTARYVRVYVDSYSNSDHGNNGIPDWNTISIYEIEVFGILTAENIALGRPAKADSEETADLTAEKAFDGDKTTSKSRWSSDVGDAPHWLYCDLGADAELYGVNLTWETRKATDYSIQVACAGSNLTSEDSWTTISHLTERPAALEQEISFDEPVTGRYVRLLINAFDKVDPDNGVSWNTISVYEMEVQGILQGEPETPETMSELLNAITVDPVTADSTSVSVHIPESAQFNVAYNGTDLEQIVDDDLNIHKPLVDKTVKLSFKATPKDGSEDYEFREIKMTIPGLYSAEENDNESPVILPELQEWKGLEGQFVLNENSRVLYADDDFAFAAQSLADDYTEISGKTITVAKAAASEAASGDIVLSRVGEETGLGKEGYYGEIGDVLRIEAVDPTGAYWSTRTILQALKADEGMDAINAGYMRDYPVYSTRSLMLDVGRKTFSIDFLRQMAKQMSWYKMNDFQIHLSDNYIWVEEYKTNGLNVFEDCYSGFRLESDIKAGGNNGLNKHDLTSKDVYYTKDDFRDFIKTSRSMGVNIVPEFDVPAHSLAYTKVRPDLAMESGINRPFDHFNLAEKFDDCVEFIQSVFDEYMSGEDPVFDEQTTVHIGSDEYEASQPAYRKFVNVMLDHVQSTGRQARVWASLSSMKQGEEVLGNGAEANIWSNGWGSFDTMYRKGFKLININDGQNYIVPNATYYADYLNENTIYNADINTYSGTTIPAGDKAMIGGGFAVWNDMCGLRENGMSEYDIYRRINSVLPLYGAKAWGKQGATLSEAKEIIAIQGSAPDVNFEYEVDKKDGVAAHINLRTLQDASGNGHTITLNQGARAETVYGLDALHLSGENATASVEGLETAGLGNDLRVKVKREDASNREQILFESPYGSIKAVQKDTGRVGITRENHDYSFNYTLPVGQWVELEIKNEFELTHLYVNGVLVDTLGTHTRGQTKATCMLPAGTIGSSEKAFNGYVADLRLGDQADFNSTIALDQAVELGSAIAQDQTVEGLAEALEAGKAVLAKYSPTAEEISAAAAAITAITDNAEVTEADYSSVDLYLGLVPADLSFFTEESRSVLETAVGAVRRNLPAAMQSTVDGMANALSMALSGLEIRELDDGTEVPNSSMTATADSQETANEDNKASNAIDGNPATFWHSQWSNTTMPHWLSLDLGETRTVTGLTYVPRPSGNNGIATSYEIQVSDDGETFTAVKTGTLASDSSTKTITLDEPVETRHVRFVIKAAMGGNFGSAAEIKVHQQAPAADVAGLNALIAKAEGMKAENFTEASYAALTGVVSDAKAAAADENLTYQAAEEAKASLLQAMAALKPAGSEVVDTADKTLLSAAISYAEAAKANGALEGLNELVVKEFESALSEAKGILNNPYATQDEVNASWSRLTHVIQMLDFKTDFTQLDALIARAEALSEADYTPETWTVLQSALAHAVEVRNDPASLTEQSIAEAINTLSSALDGLVHKDVDEVNVRLLRLVVSTAEDIDLADYIEESQEEFTASLNAAKALLAAYDNGSAIEQKAADDAAFDLNIKLLALRLRPDEKVLEALREFTAQVAALDFSLYTTETASTIREGAARISNNLTRSDYTAKEAQEDLKLAGELQKLIDNPDKVENPAEKPENPQKPAVDYEQKNDPATDRTEQKTEQKTETSNKSVKKSVKTAASSGFAALMLAAAASGLSLLGVRRRKKSQK